MLACCYYYLFGFFLSPPSQLLLTLTQMSPNQVQLFTALNGKSPPGLFVFVIPKLAAAQVQNYNHQ